MEWRKMNIIAGSTELGLVILLHILVNNDMILPFADRSLI